MTIVNMVGGGKNSLTYSFEPTEIKVPSILPQVGFTADINGYVANTVSGVSTLGTTRYEATKAFVVKNGVLNLYDMSGPIATTTAKTITEFGTAGPYPVCRMSYGFVSRRSKQLYIVDDEYTGHVVSIEYADIAYDGTDLWEFYIDASGLHRKKITVDPITWEATFGDTETLSDSLTAGSVNGWVVCAMFGPSDVQIETVTQSGSYYYTHKYDFTYENGWSVTKTQVDSKYGSAPSEASKYGSAQEGVGYVSSYGYPEYRWIPGGYANTVFPSNLTDVTWVWDDSILYNGKTIYQLSADSYQSIVEVTGAYSYLTPTTGLVVSTASKTVSWYSNGYLYSYIWG